MELTHSLQADLRDIINGKKFGDMKVMSDEINFVFGAQENHTLIFSFWNKFYHIRYNIENKSIKFLPILTEVFPIQKTVYVRKEEL